MNMTNLTTIVFLHQNITPKMTKYVGQYITNRSVSDYFFLKVYLQKTQINRLFFKIRIAGSVETISRFAQIFTNYSNLKTK
jgi:hypothetical protein